METATALSIVERFRAKTPKSAALFERAKAAFPSGLTHDSRVLDPYPVFVERAAASGSRLELNDADVAAVGQLDQSALGGARARFAWSSPSCLSHQTPPLSIC